MQVLSKMKILKTYQFFFFLGHINKGVELQYIYHSESNNYFGNNMYISIKNLNLT